MDNWAWGRGGGGGGGGDVWTEEWEVRVRRAVARTLCEQSTWYPQCSYFFTCLAETLLLCDLFHDADSTTGNTPCIDRQMFPARNAIDAHAQDFVMNDELLLPIREALAYCTRSVHSTRNAPSFQPVCSTRTVCRAYQLQPSSCLYSQQSPHRTIHSPTPSRILSCGL